MDIPTKSFWDEKNIESVVIDGGTVVHGNTLDVLRAMPSDLISCVITSPPYYALRQYGDETVVDWYGDQNCEHEYDRKFLKHRSSDGHDDLNRYNDDAFEQLRRDKPYESSFCIKCGAWHGQLGNEPSVDLFIAHLLQIFAEVKRVLRPDGVCFVEINDTYGGSGCGAGHMDDTHLTRPISEYDAGGNKQYTKGMEKSLLGVPFKFVIGMTDMGWILRNTIIVWKRSCVPASAQDRFTVDFSYLFFFTKNRSYYFEQQFEPNWQGTGMRNIRCVWDVTKQVLHDEHYAPFPETLVEIPLRAGCPEKICKVCDKPRKRVVKKEYLLGDSRGGKYKGIIGLHNQPYAKGFNVSDIYYDDCDCPGGDDKWRPGIVLDPFSGSGTTGVVALKQRKYYIGIEAVQSYINISLKRLAEVNLSQKTLDAISDKKPAQQLLF